MATIGVITNPNSKKNRRETDKRRDLQSVVGAHGLVRETDNVDEIADVLREFLDCGVRYWVSDGGDGALHWMLNEARGVLDEYGAEHPLVVPTNGGTIDFVAQKAQIRGHAFSILDALVDRVEGRRAPFDIVEVDTLRVTGETVDGDTFEKIGFACAIAGVGQNFFDKYYLSERPGPADIVQIVLTTVASFAVNMTPLRKLPLFSADFLGYADDLFRAKRARVVIDGKQVPWTEHRAIHAGSMDVRLGFMKVFPLAAVPGVLNFHAGAITPLEIIFNLYNLYRGLPVSAERFFEGGGAQMVVMADADDPLTPVIDGELYHGLVRLVVEPGPTIPVPRIQP